MSLLEIATDNDKNYTCQCQWHHPPPAGRQSKPVQCQLSVNSVSPSIKLVISSNLKSHLSSDSPRRMVFWLSLCKLKSMKVTADLCLDKAGLLVIAHTWQEATYSLQSAVTQHSWNGKGRPEKPRPLVSLSTFSDLLWWPPQGLANSAQNVSLNERFINKFVYACSIVFILLW